MSAGSDRDDSAEGRSRGILGGFAEFLSLEIAGSVLLLGATVLALVIANSQYYVVLERLLHVEIGVEVGQWVFTQSLKHWIDDGLMAVFFFVIGLEVKREIVAGELSKPRQAMLPVIAAIGGMLAPAIIYLAFNMSGPGARGWGIPMATDIAFALGVLTVLGSRTPAGLKLFLTALAIADDIGAILVIALFYTSGVKVGWLAGWRCPAGRAGDPQRVQGRCDAALRAHRRRGLVLLLELGGACDHRWRAGCVHDPDACQAARSRLRIDEPR